MSRYKMAHDIPDWLVRLLPGDYTIMDVEKLTGAQRTNIFMRFETLGVKKSRKKFEGHWRNIYSWKGSSFYWAKEYESKKKSLEKWSA